MLPNYQPLTVKDLNEIGVAATLVGFVGFAASLWLLVWLGMDEKGKLKPVFKWLAFLLVICYAAMLWGLTKG
ncbi:MAG: hypothetical protein NZ805_02735 [Armatimonadetes bacterium]|nr:hypothetical protein [Armatimonadota bacterium]MDW8028788.1 hypothetical protein [Armatimonadota bacterium]